MNSVGYAEFRASVLAYYLTKSPAAYGKMRYVLDRIEVQGVQTTADLTTTMVARFVADRGPTANPNTTRGLISYLKAAVNFAAEEGWLDRLPSWRKVTPAPGPSARRKVLTPDQVSRLLTHLEAMAVDWKGRRLFSLATTVAYTGLRLREALFLDVSDLDLDSGFLTVVPRRRRLKTSASADTVPVPDRAASVLRTWSAECGHPWVFPGVKRRGPWTGGECGRRSIDGLQAAAKAVGIAWTSWHSLRHTYATTALKRWNVPLWAVQRSLRHTSSRTTALYLGGDDTPALAALLKAADYRTD